MQVSEVVEFSGMSGKQGTFELSRYEKSGDGWATVNGVELTMSLFADWETLKIEGGTCEFRLVTDSSSPAWYMTLDSDSDGQKWKQFLSPVSESDWSL
jgi:hypothetical protein